MTPTKSVILLFIWSIFSLWLLVIFMSDREERSLADERIRYLLCFIAGGGMGIYAVRTILFLMEDPS